MVFVTGGNSQGKLEFVKETFRLKDGDVADGASCDLDKAFRRPVLYRFHLYAARLRAAGVDAAQAVEKGLGENPDVVVICDDLGCGIVPLRREDRGLREEVGRLQCLLALRAKKVYRVVCGLPQLLKDG